jgi:hypothetical protein
MHLQQSKIGKSGGPQYWLQHAPGHIFEHILRHKKCQVILQTPYGPVETPFNAVDPDRNVVAVEKAVASKAGRDRIPKGLPCESTAQYGLEKITSAAVKLTNGRVFTGLFHGDALAKARSIYTGTSEPYFSKLFGKSEDGFITSKGRFVDSDEAYRIAIKRCQIKPRCYVEAVHDLWGNDVHPNGELCALAFQNVRADKSPSLKAFENARFDQIPSSKYANKKRTSR